MTEAKCYPFSQNQDEIDLIIDNISKMFDSAKYYSLIQLRKIIKNLRFTLSEKNSLKNIKVISNLLLSNLPRHAYVNKKVLGQIIIDHVNDDLREKIKAKFCKFIGNNSNVSNIQVQHRPSSTNRVDEPKNMPEGDSIPIARVIPGSNTKVIKCRITNSFQHIKDINGRYVTLKPFEGVRVLGQISNIYTVNNTPNYILAPTMNSDVTNITEKQTIIDLDSRISDVYIRKVLDGSTKKNELGNAPPTTTDIFLANQSEMEEFFNIIPDYPISFLKTVGHLSFIPKFDLLKMIRRHIYILGITDAGKGYFANALLLSCVGRTIRIAQNIHRKIGCLYFDFTGQFAHDSYGFFNAWAQESGTDPRVVIPGDRVGVQTPEDLIEIFFRKYRILDLGFASQKIAGMRRYLLTRITINASFYDFQRELPCAIRNIYSGSPINHIERISCHLEALGPTIWDNEIEPLKSPDLFRDIDSNLRDGRFVVIDLSRIREREYKPGVVYRILRFLDTLLKENFSNTQRETDYPVFVGLDEAHNFAPGTSNLRRGYYIDECNELIARMCAEDRKTGLCMVIITQRLAWTNRDVRANIGLWCVSKINSVDEDQAKKCMGNHNFTNYKYKTFHLFGDSSPIPAFPTKALNPAVLAENKRKEG